MRSLYFNVPVERQNLVDQILNSFSKKIRQEVKKTSTIVEIWKPEGKEIINAASYSILLRCGSKQAEKIAACLKKTASIKEIFIYNPDEK